MKRKQIMAMVLSGILTFSAVSPVLAADIPDSEAPAAAAVSTAADQTAAETSVQDAAETSVQDTANQESKDQETKEQGNALSGDTASAAVNAAKKEAADPNASNPNVTDSTTPSNADAAAGTEKATEGTSSLVSDEMIQSMSANLTALLQQVLDKYNSMTADEKAALDEMYGGHVDVQSKIDDLKAQVTFSELKGLISGSASDKAANDALTRKDEEIVGQVDSWNYDLESARTYASDYDQYLQNGIAAATKQLQNILLLDHELFTKDFMSQIQAYYDKIITLEPGVQSNVEITKFVDGVYDYISQSSKYLNKAVVEDGKRAAAAFAAFVNSAPDPAIANTTFNYGEGRLMTYGEIADYVGAYADYLMKNLNYTELSDFYNNYYLNLVNAYNGVSAEILKSVTGQVADAVYVGYAGSEKGAYDAALQNYNDTFAAKNYAALPDAVKSLGNAAKAYAQASEDYMKAEGNTQISSLKAQLTAVQSDISSHSEYYNSTYPAEVEAMLQQLANADVNNMTGRQIFDLLKNAEAVLAKRSSSYSQKLTDLIANANTQVQGANAWWSFLPDDMKGNAPYAEAIELTNQLAGGLAEVNGVYDIDKLVAAYDAFAKDFAMEDGKIQTAAKAAAQYVLDNAQAVYEKEAKNKHTDGFLKDLEDAISQLKSSIAAWDYNKTREAAQIVKAAETKLVNDKPQQKVEKADSKKDKKNAVKTGDTTDASQAGILGLFSLTAAAGVLGIRRRR